MVHQLIYLFFIVSGVNGVGNSMEGAYNILIHYHCIHTSTSDCYLYINSDMLIVELCLIHMYLNYIQNNTALINTRSYHSITNPLYTVADQLHDINSNCADRECSVDC